MKRFLVIACMLLTGATLATADPPEDVLHPYNDAGYWFLQFDLGLNFTFLDGNPFFRPRLKGDSPSDLYTSASGIGPHIDGQIGYRFNDMFALHFGIGYDAFTASNSAVTEDTCTIEDPIDPLFILEKIDRDYEVSGEYVSFSLIGDVYFDKFFIFAGPSVAVPVGTTVTETNVILDSESPCGFFYDQTDPLAPPIKVRSGTLTDDGGMGTRVALKLGAGYLFEITKQFEAVVQVGYEQNLSDMFTENPTVPMHSPDGLNSFDMTVNRGIRLSALQATVGIRINL